MLDYQKEFIQYALDCGVLKFGEFQLKSGRTSPYFFNTGLFNTGAELGRLGQFYARTLIESKLQIDVLYGPAYKGIPLVSATSIAYSQLKQDIPFAFNRKETKDHGEGATSIAYSQLKQDIPFAFNRKETKDHGEGGTLVGAPLQGKVLILDDVITAGTSVRESVEIINAMNAEPAGVLIALDRQEKGENEMSAIQEVSERFKMPVISIISLTHIIEFLELNKNSEKQLETIKLYRLKYGV
jgi:orotate phosphoribosyltransferase